MHRSNSNQRPIFFTRRHWRPRWLRGGAWGSFGRFHEAEALKAERVIIRPDPWRGSITWVLSLRPGAFRNFARFVDPPQMAETNCKVHLTLTQPGRSRRS
jgi:hypothetical protein